MIRSGGVGFGLAGPHPPTPSPSEWRRGSHGFSCTMPAEHGGMFVA